MSVIVSKVTTNYGSMLDLAFIKVCSKSQVQTDVLEAYWSDHVCNCHNNQIKKILNEAICKIASSFLYNVFL
jgi:hypothetical protein